ncbi:MAG: NUDIX hydrolase [Rhodospirillales bacterium]|nr:NUDIX hydrolase [Rhodospirillales bacterium]
MSNDNDFTAAPSSGGTAVKRTYPQTPLVGVGAIVFNRGRVLLVRRAKDPRRGQWSLPGGLQKLGETVAEAACREVLEETSLAIRVLGLADVVDLIERDDNSAGGGGGDTGGKGRVRYHYTLVDLVACCDDDAIRPGSDAAEAVWADAGALDGYGLWAETIRVIALALKTWRAAGSP